MVDYNESPSAPRPVAGEVMETGRCWIDGIECVMTEARFGGIVVQPVTEP